MTLQAPFCMSDSEIVQALINKDEFVTREFFFVKCRPLFYSIIRSIFSYGVNYDEFVNELYVYLISNDAHKLKQFNYRSTLMQWLKVVSIHYFIKKRDELIEDSSKEALYDSEENSASEAEPPMTARMDLEKLFSEMSNKRYVLVISSLLLDGEDPSTVAIKLGVTIANLYNIKKRAMTALTRVALNDIQTYGRHE